MNYTKKDSCGEHYTWSNKQAHNIIYFRINRVITNVSWHQRNVNTNLNITEPSVSDHALLCLQVHEEVRQSRKKYFKFQNIITKTNGSLQTVAGNWNQHINGSATYILWQKLLRLQYDKKLLSKLFKGITHQLEKARE